METVTIIRDGHPNCERAVRVVLQDRKHWAAWVNPTTELRKATGLQFNRTGCIVSFADGIASTGANVWIDDRRTNKGRGLQRHRNVFSSMLVYWLFGRLWTLGEWQTFVATMDRNKIPLGTPRQAVIEETASFYFERPWERTTRIMLPVL